MAASSPRRHDNSECVNYRSAATRDWRISDVAYDCRTANNADVPTAVVPALTNNHRQDLRCAHSRAGRGSDDTTHCSSSPQQQHHRPSSNNNHHGDAKKRVLNGYHSDSQSETGITACDMIKEDITRCRQGENCQCDADTRQGGGGVGGGSGTSIERKNPPACLTSHVAPPPQPPSSSYARDSITAENASTDETELELCYSAAESTDISSSSSGERRWHESRLESCSDSRANNALRDAIDVDTKTVHSDDEVLNERRHHNGGTIKASSTSQSARQTFRFNGSHHHGNVKAEKDNGGESDRREADRGRHSGNVVSTSVTVSSNGSINVARSDSHHGRHDVTSSAEQQQQNAGQSQLQRQQGSSQPVGDESVVVVANGTLTPPADPVTLPLCCDESGREFSTRESKRNIALKFNEAKRVDASVAKHEEEKATALAEVTYNSENGVTLASNGINNNGPLPGRSRKSVDEFSCAIKRRTELADAAKSAHFDDDPRDVVAENAKDDDDDASSTATELCDDRYVSSSYDSTDDDNNRCADDTIDDNGTGSPQDGSRSPPTIFEVPKRFLLKTIRSISKTFDDDEVGTGDIDAKKSLTAKDFLSQTTNDVPLSKSFDFIASEIGYFGKTDGANSVAKLEPNKRETKQGFAAAGSSANQVRNGNNRLSRVKAFFGLAAPADDDGVDTSDDTSGHKPSDRQSGHSPAKKASGIAAAAAAKPTSLAASQSDYTLRYDSGFAATPDPDAFLHVKTWFTDYDTCTSGCSQTEKFFLSREG